MANWAVIFVLIAQLCCSCSLVSQKLDPQTFYRRDIQLDVNDQKFDGAGVPNFSDEYKIKIKSIGKIDMLTIQSCHRHESFENVGGGIFGASKTFTYIYRPIKGIEDGRGCLLDIGVYERSKGRHGWATLDFQTKMGAENLPAHLLCDGKEWSTDPNSVSICQAKNGTIQKIVFDHRVKVSPDARCDVMKTTDEMTYTYLMPVGECTFYFGDKYGNFHRHTTLGFENVLIRGE